MILSKFRFLERTFNSIKVGMVQTTLSQEVVSIKLKARYENILQTIVSSPYIWSPPYCLSIIDHCPRGFLVRISPNSESATSF